MFLILFNIILHESKSAANKHFFYIFKLGGMFLLFLSFFLAICFFFYILYRILTKLDHNHAWEDRYRSYTLCDLRGHLGVKMLTTWKIWKQLQFKIWLCHLVDNSQSFQKVNGDFVMWPHLKGSKVKMCHFFKIFKMLFLLQITSHGHVTHAY